MYVCVRVHLYVSVCIFACALGHLCTLSWPPFGPFVYIVMATCVSVEVFARLCISLRNYVHERENICLYVTQSTQDSHAHIT